MRHQDLNDFGVNMMDAACLYDQLDPKDWADDEELHEAIRESLRLMSEAIRDLKEIIDEVGYVDDGSGHYALSTYVR